MKVNLTLNGLISESAREKPTVAPEWWQRKSRGQQQAYIKRHPGSYLKDMVKTSDKVRPSKQVVEKSRAKSKAIQAPSLREKRKTPPEPVIKRKESDGQYKIPKRPSMVSKVARSIKEKLFRHEEQRRTDSKLPGVKSRIAEGVKKFADNLGSLASTYKEQVSPANMKSLAGFLNAKQNGELDESHEKGRHVANKIILNAAYIALGLGAAGAIASGAAPLAGALTAAFFGFKDWRKGLDGTGKPAEVSPEPESEENEDTEVDSEDMVAESKVAIDSQNPVDALVDEFALWVGNQDLDGIAEQIAAFEALQEMEDEGYVPDEADFSDEELDTILAASKADQDMLDEAAESDDEDADEDMVSESSVVPRLSFRAKVRHKNPSLRKVYDIVFANRVIGGLRCEGDFANKQKRVWVPVLFDGFNEAVYQSGPTEREPYTLVKKGKVCLTNPVPSTFSECCSWVKHNIDRKFL